ncbi:DUF421 domain-containing protein [Montanilutibacter psychrotolerans]|uniref:DUF421 domain-containing protein n=1 Tax=Montanilutibacter psychrotolerans TaxID=1327343 RepID=A0A3M8SNI7_9GAMM|nr:YetF domain-containing protein [Lysobacter psychrotolerans]RNF82363.1 DUF421 domain-containing protein [Lysobacter psychrotolerans]
MEPSSIWEPSLPWWELVLRPMAVYLGVMLLLRMSGKRAVGQMTPFDLVLLILIGNAVQNGLNGGDNSLTTALVLSLCLLSLNYAVAWLSARKPAARRLIEGEPVVLARDGHVFQQVLRRELVSRADFDEAMRESGCGDLARVRLALLETNGRISIELRDDDEAP